MKVDFGQELKTMRGADLKERVVTEESPEGVMETITLGGCAIGALLNPEQGVEGKVKAKRYALAIRIQECDNGVLELKIEEVALIKKLIGKAFNVLMVGQCWNMLEKKKEQEAEAKAEAAKKVNDAESKAKEEAPEEAKAAV
jgi:hypothetical protein